MPRTKNVGPLEAAIHAALATSDSPAASDVSDTTGRTTFENAELVRMLTSLFRPTRRRSPSYERQRFPQNQLPPLF